MSIKSRTIGGESIEENGGQAIGVVANVAKHAMINTTMDAFNSLDILVNNAGIMDNITPG
ncbi:hypothetical protein ABE28_003330 [Peribacillus muralis]|uniref:Short-chain dehydrogenase n=1 Tax=Peribacillus muralis TaxID=264697 RepID=A0A1B3XJI1_9BACI|nr:hypothetical protein [Peribacillus muralis]AOH53371.1 hypothetical protein ABE28_003330 [Peribacillus muralis]